MGLFQPPPPDVPTSPGIGWDPARYVMRSLDEQPLGCDCCGSPSVLSQSARAHGAALACARPPEELRQQGLWAAEGTLEPWQSSRQGLYMLPLQ